MEPKKAKHRNRIEWWLPGARFGKSGEMFRKYRHTAMRQISSGDLIHSMMTIINNSTVLYT